MGYQITVENIKCGGCANSIRKRLIADARIEDVEIDIAQGIVNIQGAPAAKADAIEILASLGYPEVGSVEGLRAAATKAKSFVSCAVGRMDKASG
jgi:copper chaperone